MKLMIILLLITFISQTLLSAKDIYIEVTSVKTKQKLRVVNNRFHNIKLPMIYKNFHKKYYIYSGPYKEEQQSLVALKKIKHYFPKARIKKEKKSKTDIKESGVYLNIAVGFSSAPSTNELEEGSVIIQKPQSTGVSYNISTGYSFENGLSIGIGYLRFNATDLLFNNMYGELNYQFNDYDSFIPYIGILGGYSSLTWFTDPIDNPDKDANNDSSSFIVGTQTGLMYKITDIFSLYFGYQCLFMNHVTNITLDSSNSSKLEHNTLHTVQIGLHF